MKSRKVLAVLLGCSLITLSVVMSILGSSKTAPGNRPIAKVDFLSSFQQISPHQSNVDTKDNATLHQLVYKKESQASEPAKPESGPEQNTADTNTVTDNSQQKNTVMNTHAGNSQQYNTGPNKATGNSQHTDASPNNTPPMDSGKNDKNDSTATPVSTPTEKSVVGLNCSKLTYIDHATFERCPKRHWGKTSPAKIAAHLQDTKKYQSSKCNVQLAKWKHR